MIHTRQFIQDNSYKVNDRSMEYEKYGMQFF